MSVVPSVGTTEAGTQMASTYAYFCEDPAKSKPYTKPMYCLKLCKASNDLQILSQISSLILFYHIDKCCL